MTDVYSLGLWCVANLVMFIVILTKNEALNVGTLDLVTQNLRRLIDEMSRYMAEPTGYPVQFTSNLNNQNVPKTGQSLSLPSTSYMCSTLNKIYKPRLHIQDSVHVNKYTDTVPKEINSLQAHSSVNWTSIGPIPEVELSNTDKFIEDHKPSTKNLEDLCKAYKVNKRSFDRKMDDFQNKLDENRAGISQIIKGTEINRRIREQALERTNKQSIVEVSKIIEDVEIKQIGTLTTPVTIPGNSIDKQEPFNKIKAIDENIEDKGKIHLSTKPEKQQKINQAKQNQRKPQKPSTTLGSHLSQKPNIIKNKFKPLTAEPDNQGIKSNESDPKINSKQSKEEYLRKHEIIKNMTFNHKNQSEDEQVLKNVIGYSLSEEPYLSEVITPMKSEKDHRIEKDCTMGFTINKKRELTNLIDSKEHNVDKTKRLLNVETEENNESVIDKRRRDQTKPMKTVEKDKKTDTEKMHKGILGHNKRESSDNKLQDDDKYVTLSHEANVKNSTISTEISEYSSDEETFTAKLEAMRTKSGMYELNTKS